MKDGARLHPFAKRGLMSAVVARIHLKNVQLALSLSVGYSVGLSSLNITARYRGAA